ncbi:hypothetical protein PO909_029176 [Leuciscus waleckii]
MLAGAPASIRGMEAVPGPAERGTSYGQWCRLGEGCKASPQSHHGHKLAMRAAAFSERESCMILTQAGNTDDMVVPVSPAGLFGSSVKDFADRFAEVQKTSQAMKHFLPKRSRSAAGRSKQPSARSSQPQAPPTAAASQRRQTRDQRPRSRSAGRRPPPRGPRPKIEMKPEASKPS